MVEGRVAEIREVREEGGGWSGITAAGGVAAEEGSDFVAIAANGHGAPAAVVCARVVVEEKATRGIGATADRRVGALDEELGGGTRNGGEEPLETTLAGDEFQPPAFGVGNEFVVPFREAKQIIDGLDPAFGEGLLLHERRKDGAEGFAQAEDFEENGVDGLWFREQQRMKACGPFGCDNARADQEGHEFVPGEVVSGGSSIGEIEGEAAGDEVGLGVGERIGHARRVR